VGSDQRPEVTIFLAEVIIRRGSPPVRAASCPNLDAGRELAYAVARGNGVWFQAIRVEVAGQRLRTYDGLAVEDEATLDVRAAEIVVFDLR
jgi:hypothetical protein